jgi:integrase
MRLRGVDPARVEAMYAELVQTKGWSRQSLVSLRSTLGQMFAFAVKRRMITPADDLIRYTTIPADAAKPKRRSSLTLDQARALWDGVGEHRLGAMWRVGLLTGLRPGELAGLLWSSVDLDSSSPSITISRSVQLVKGTPELRDGVKTDGSYRTIGLAPQLVPVLRAHKHAQDVERIAARHWHDQGLVFTTSSGELLNPSNVRRELTSVCERLHLPSISSNELRHTAASLMIDAGMTLDQVARVLGHANTRMLERHYAHRVRPVIDDHVSAMAMAFEGVGS